MRIHIVRGLETLFHLLMLLLLMGAFIPLWREMSGSPPDPAEGDALQRALLLAGYSIVGAGLLLSPTRTLRLIFSTPLMWALVTLALLSLLWSEAPSISLRRGMALLLTTLYGLALFLYFDFDRFMQLLGAALCITLFISLALALLLPEWGRHTYFGETAWRGIFIHKNSLGRICALALLVCGWLWANHPAPRRRWLWALGTILALALLLPSRSAAGVVLSLAVAAGMILLSLYQRMRKDYLIVSLAGALLATMVSLVLLENLQGVLLAFGKQPSLTGRMPLWNLLVEIGKQSPWLGFGYGAFWLGWSGSLSTQVWQTITWLPPHAHNGYLDLWLQLGMVGLLIAVLWLVGMLKRAWGRLMKGERQAQFWLLLLAFIIMMNIIESTLAKQNSLFWVLLVYMACSQNPARVKREQELQGQIEGIESEK